MPETVPTEPVLEQKRGFHWEEVPPTRGRAAAVAREATADPDLGPLVGFTGVFQGTGLNTIFRPQNVALTPTKLDKPAHGQDDNILEINLTRETLSFANPIGSIPNRGLVQGDIFLNGVPYLQTISDVNDPDHPVDIHLEPGVWLSVPKTDVPAEGPTIARMASIPHGTTVEAQGTSFTVQGGPQIAPVDITPFPIGGDQAQNPVRFPSQTVADDATFRLPQDLSSFAAAGTITQAILDDPSTVLRDRVAKQTITTTAVITIDTQPAAPLFGGGTSNIAFLRGDPAAANPNADAVRMSAIFWIETVAERITVPALEAGTPVVVHGDAGAGDPVPSFAVTSATGTSAPTEIDVTYPQIQYTQQVQLNFNALTWPHVSVATLVPRDPVPVVL